MKQPTSAEFTALKKLLGLSKNDVSELLNKDPSAIYRWEHGQVKIPHETHQTLLDLLDYIEERVDAALEALDTNTEVVELFVYSNQEDFKNNCPGEVDRLKHFSVHAAMQSRIYYTFSDQVRLVKYDSKVHKI